MVVADIENIEFDPRSLETALGESNISQADLARIMGYSHRNTVNKILKGKREATATELLKFSAVLGKSPVEFAKAR